MTDYVRRVVGMPPKKFAFLSNYAKKHGYHPTRGWYAKDVLNFYNKLVCPRLERWKHRREMERTYSAIEDQV